ncbi:helix-turn-helix domain-containing protein [Lactococcus allomyrinae]|uniref:XRE family transcriptional regulator n=1 Tax=Lactococcus allomyrinae TaxID=2419773 RepID=A0A387BIM9_9LACT|nr:helix-turn-helix transcriptional regulator [Lactococcus allomyrinae]AYG01209.1 XRE family transcriptional regulator [Lactococcus allomyrinae]
MYSKEYSHAAIIAQNIKKYLSENKMLQKELAERVGIAPSTMTDYLKLRSRPSHGVIQKMADVFGVAKSDIDTTYKIEETQSLETMIDSASLFEEVKIDEEDRVAIKDLIRVYFLNKHQ